MKSSYELLLTALIAIFAIFHIVQAQDQEGFISLDCGLPPTETSPYTEPVTKLLYSSDSDFIQSGKLGRTDTSLQTYFLKQQTTLRYFPEGTRNCYNLTVKQGTNYLIRARFTYGNYDGLNIYPSFDLYMGPNLWTRLDMQKYGDTNSTLEEISYIPRSNSLDVCLVRTGTSTPFMSALELRPLPSNSYITTAGSLRTFLRVYFSNSVGAIRYPMDFHDRMWRYYFEEGWRQISTSLTVNTSDSFRLPQAALITAAVPENGSAPFMDIEFSMSSKDRVFIYLHFSEVQALRANETREFNISFNGESVADSFSPVYLQSKTVYNQLPYMCEECIIKLSKTQNSTHPPMLNAIEVFTVSEFLQSETYENDVDAIKNIKGTYGLNRLSWQGDPCVPRSLMWDDLDCTDTDTYIAPRITSLNLSSSGLTGTIATEIQNLTNLQKLDLSNNNLTGVVPEFLANMKSLLFIDLRKNNLNGSIPKTLLDRETKGLQLFVDGDGDKGDDLKCLSSSCVPKKKFPIMIVALAASAVVVIAVVIILIFLFRKKKRSSLGVTSTSISEESIETKRRRFTYSEVVEMTKNFQKTLGEGGFGTVYHGNLNGSEQVAVKLLSQSSSQGYKHFKAEVELLLRVHHINLVSLVGYCDERDHLALIYECMSNGDLKDHLSGKHGNSVLKWSTRLRKAVDAALGLEYLHYGCRPSIVHRDIKSTNILLDDQFKAKIADFGLSRSFQLGEESHASTDVAGTLGYLDPEYYRTCRLAEMSDVYSFGILLLEIITNQNVIDQAREKAHITEWVELVLKGGDVTRIVDPNLDGEYNSRSVWKALKLAMSCANPSLEYRPNMSQVVTDLKECITSENSMKCMDHDMDSNRLTELKL